VSGLPLLVQAWRQPGQLGAFTLAQWDLLLRQADHADMTASLLYLCEEHAVLDAIPAPAREQLEWSRTHSARHAQAVHWEVRRIQHALRGIATPIILLKGAAYTLAGLPPGRGRLYSDIDIMVPKELLGAVESALMLAGWVGGHHDAYDQRYYREWMHELPPMQHIKRQSLIDVHHAILPPTAAARPDPLKLRAAAHALDGHPGLQVLAPADMVLHSAVHLFYDGEFNHGLRDLADLHRLLDHFSGVQGFWEALPQRAHQLELARPLFYALRYAGRLLDTKIPPAALAAAERGRPNPALLALMDLLFGRALRPGHASCSDWLTPLAHGLLYLRGNWLRMPPLMLARHLFHKAFISKRKK
jgi:hypothetical protein